MLCEKVFTFFVYVRLQMNNDIAGSLLKSLGGKENIRAMEHCSTRLRIVVDDNNLVDPKAIKKVEKVAGYFFYFV